MSKVMSALHGVASTTARFDATKVSLDVGIRASAGIAVPLLIGQLTGHTIAGVTASIGALNAGFASLQGTYRSRAELVMAATAATAATAFAGATVGHIFGPDIAITAGVGFLAGLCVSLGQAATVVGVQAIVGLVVFSQFSLPAGVAARDSGLICLGGAVQVLLIVGLWPLRRFPAERRALGDVFAALGAYSRALPGGGTGLLDPAVFERLEVVLRDPQPFGGDEAAYNRALAAQAERLRLQLAGLAQGRTRLAGASASEAVARTDAILTASGAVLDAVARAIRQARSPSDWDDRRDDFEAALERLGVLSLADDPLAGAIVSDTRRQCEALAGQLRTILRLAAAAAGDDAAAMERTALTGRASPRPPSWTLTRSWGTERAATIRSDLSLSSQAFRHALRLAVTLAMAVALSHLFSAQHRYWLPMTAMLVLRPDFASTFTRGVSRVIGTLVGAGLVTVILAGLRPGPIVLSVFVVGLCFAATSLLQANYAVYSACIASLVVCLLAFTGEPDVSTAGARALYTVVGAALALSVYALWPTWEATSLADTLAGLIRTEGRYTTGVLAAWDDPKGADRVGLQEVRRDARRSRGNAEAAVTRWLGEPLHQDGLDRDEILGLMAEVRSLVQATLGLHAELPDHQEQAPLLGELVAGVGDTLDRVAAAIESHPVSGCRPSALRDAHVRLVAQLGLTDDTGGAPIDERAVILAGETDMIVNSVNTLALLVGVTEPD